MDLLGDTVALHQFQAARQVTFALCVDVLLSGFQCIAADAFRVLVYLATCMIPTDVFIGNPGQVCDQMRKS